MFPMFSDILGSKESHSMRAFYFSYVPINVILLMEFFFQTTKIRNMRGRLGFSLVIGIEPTGIKLKYENQLIMNMDNPLRKKVF